MQHKLVFSNVCPFTAHEALVKPFIIFGWENKFGKGCHSLLSIMHPTQIYIYSSFPFFFTSFFNPSFLYHFLFFLPLYTPFLEPSITTSFAYFHWIPSSFPFLLFPCFLSYSMHYFPFFSFYSPFLALIFLPYPFLSIIFVHTFPSLLSFRLTSSRCLTHLSITSASLPFLCLALLSLFYPFLSITFIPIFLFFLSLHFLPLHLSAIPPSPLPYLPRQVTTPPPAQHPSPRRTRALHFSASAGSRGL